MLSEWIQEHHILSLVINLMNLWQLALWQFEIYQKLLTVLVVTF